MALFVLAKEFVFGSSQLRTGKIIDSNLYDIASLKASGALLIPLPNPIIEERAREAREQQSKGRKGYEVEVLLSAYALFSEAVQQEKCNIQLIGLKDGLNSFYETPEVFIPSSLKIYLNGIRQDILCDYQITAPNQIQILRTKLPLLSDSLTADYKFS